MLRLENIEVSYGDAKALFGVSLSITNGELVALVGANGAGKTTVLNAISGLKKPSKGQVILDGVDITQWESTHRVSHGICHVLEGRQMFSGMTVKENLMVGAYRRTDKQGIRQDYDFIMDLFPSLKRREHHQTGLLSGGEQQMCAIGRGLMTKPRLLMIDELSLGLAPVVVDRIAEAIQRLHKERDLTILFVEQDVFLAFDMAKRAYVMDHGRISNEGATEKLLQDESLMKAYLGV